MNAQSLARNAQLCIRSEFLVAEIKLRHYQRKLGLAAIAVAFALLGLIFLNISLFQALETAWGAIWTPLIIGLANLALAAIAILIAAGSKPGPELAMAEDLRKLSVTAFAGDLQGNQSLSAGLIETNTARLLIPALTLIIGALRRKKAADR